MSNLMEAVLSEIEADRRKFEQVNTHKGYKIADLRVAFDRVCDRFNWKNPIRSWISENEVNITRAAVEFFAACEIRITDQWNNCVCVEADGYYAVCGG